MTDSVCHLFQYLVCLKLQIESIFFIPSIHISSPSPMYDHLLESSHREDSGRWSDVGFCRKYSNKSLLKLIFTFVLSRALTCLLAYPLLFLVFLCVFLCVFCQIDAYCLYSCSGTALGRMCKNDHAVSCRRGV